MKFAYVLLAALLAIPAVSALPIVCGPDCRINADTVMGYDPAVAIIASGSTVTFHSLDLQHFTRDTSIAGADQCFFVDHPGEEDAPPILFEIADGALQATVEGETLVCGNAVGDAAGGFNLQYFCVLHGFMRGALVVTT